MMKRNSIIIISVALLATVMAVFAYLNARDSAKNRDLEEGAMIAIKTDQGKLAEIGMDFIENMGLEDFSAKLDTSQSEARAHIYTGILLNEVLLYLGINTDEYDKVIARAVDGYTVAFDAAEVSHDDNIYIAIKRNGKPLGSRREGGDGPFQVVARKDSFGQRWCKFLIEIELIP